MGSPPGVVPRQRPSSGTGPAAAVSGPGGRAVAGAREARGAGRSDGLTDEQRREVERLAARDREVRRHEEAHVAAAGPLLRGGPYYETTRGPDGRAYVTSGRVEIDTSEGRTPEETIAKAERAKRAALAPAEPSSTDRSVAAKADRMKAEAQRELSEQRAEGEDRPRDARPVDGEMGGPGRLLDVIG